MSTQLGWRLHVEDVAWRGERKLYIVHREFTADRGLRTGLVMPLAVTELVDGVSLDMPTMSETRNERDDNVGDVTGFLQAAMDAAWELGLRPRGFADYSNEINAVRYHLEDMRALAKVPPRP